ncbi:MAG: hypothetical protein WBA66_13385 [Xanthobacteraceae bacterium]
MTQPNVTSPNPGRLRRRLLVRFAAWGTGAGAAVTIAIFAVQGMAGSRGTSRTVDVLAREVQGLSQSVQETGRELRRLSAAAETLSRDRDRLFARVAALERDAEIATGSIGHATTVAKSDPVRPPMDHAAAPPQVPAEKEDDGNKARETVTDGTGADGKANDKASGENAAAAVADLAMSAAADPAPPAMPANHTEFGIELGTASTVNGLRRLWSNMLKAHKDEFAALSPALAVRERPGGRVEFRLLAGPLRDAADAAKLCAGLAAAKRPCAPAVFDGQRLELTEAKAEAPRAAHRAAPKAVEPAPPPPRQ